MSRVEAKKHLTKQGSPFVIRNGELSDDEAILEFSKAVMAEQVFTLTQPEEMDIPRERRLSWIQSHHDDPSKLLIVAVMGGEIIGLLDFAPGLRKRIAHTGSFGMSVAKAHRESGVGNALLSTLLDWAKSNPAIEKVCLKVHANNSRAMALYKKHGFVEEGRLVRDLKYGPGEYVDTIEMAKFVKDA